MLPEIGPQPPQQTRLPRRIVRRDTQGALQRRFSVVNALLRIDIGRQPPRQAVARDPVTACAPAAQARPSLALWALLRRLWACRADTGLPAGLLQSAAMIASSSLRGHPALFADTVQDDLTAFLQVPQVTQALLQETQIGHHPGRR